MSGRLLPFADEFAPVWTDPVTGQGGPWTAARFRAAGFTVHTLPTADLYLVDLDSRVAALEGVEPPQVEPHVPSTGEH